jgi:flagellar basal-body rod modification protein FlgD
MEITSTSAATELQTATSEALGASGALDRDAFLQLLITQLSNQDPLSPLQDHEFVAQLASFSSLEQLENLNEAMQASLLLDQSVNNSLATNLIGKEVLVESSSLKLGEENEPTLQVELAQDASVVVLIRDEDGNLIRTLNEGEHAAGSLTVTWDGNDDAGERAEAGLYEVEILATSDTGESVETALRTRAEVIGVRFVDGVGYLVFPDEVILPLSAVVEVSAAQG